MQLFVTVIGDAPLSYQWWHDGQPVPGANGLILATNAASSTSNGATFAASGIYWLAVTNSFGTATSSNAVVEVSALPWICQQPVSQVVDPTQSATFSVQAQGIGANSPQIAYQWYKNNVAITNANGSKLAINNVGLPDQGNYYVVVGAFFGGTVQSSNAMLTISRAPTAAEMPPQITGLSSPIPASANEGRSATFKVTAVGWKPLAFQWRLNGSIIPEATHEVYSIPALSTNQSGIYSVVVSNAYGTVNQSAPPFIVNSLHASNDDFANRSTLRENSGTVYGSCLFATVEPDEPSPRRGVGGHSLWYTWTAPANGVATVDASASQFSAVVSLFHGDALKTLTAVEQTGSYDSIANIQVTAGETVQVSIDSYGSSFGYILNPDPISTPSGRAALILRFIQDPSPTEAPSITSDLATTNLSAGDTLGLLVTPTGAHPLRAQWYKDGIALPKSTATNLVITNIQAGDAGLYSVTVTNQNGSATSKPIAVTVSPVAPALVSGSSNLWVTEGYPLKLQAVVKGSAPIFYQWYWEGAPLYGETNPVLARAAATPGLNGHYTVSISNSLGTTNLPSVLVSVVPAPVRYQWSTLAGTPGQFGVADGHGSDARFWNPSGITQYSNGNLIIADSGGGSIRMVTPAGDVSTLATGFQYPLDVALEPDGSLLISDGQNTTKTYRVFADGPRTALNGGGWGVTPGPIGSVYQIGSTYAVTQIQTNGTSKILVKNLNAPVDATLDTLGNLYIAEAGGATIRKLSPDGVLTVLAGKPGVYSAADGPADSALFQHPNSVSFDAEGNLFVADEFGPTIRKIDRQGMVSTVGGLYLQSGSTDGRDMDARFSGPRRVLATPEGLLYVVDTGNHTIRVGTPIPVLTVRLSAGLLQLTWPQSPNGFVLETTKSLNSAPEWIGIHSGIASDGRQWRYIESAADGQRYYRLRHP